MIRRFSTTWFDLRRPVRGRRAVLHRIHPRRGTTSLQAVMVAAVLVPLAFLLLKLAIRASVMIHQLIVTSLSWPYP